MSSEELSQDFSWFPYLRRQIWERIIRLVSFFGWEYPVIEVTVLKESVFTILSKKFQGQSPPEWKMFLLPCRFSRGTDLRQKEKGPVCTMGRPGEELLDPVPILFLHFYLSWVLVENSLIVPRKCLSGYRTWMVPDTPAGLRWVGACCLLFLFNSSKMLLFWFGLDWN